MGKRIKLPENVILGENVRKYRELLALSRETLAERLDLSPSYIADVERGMVGVSIKTLKTLCAVLSVSADALLFDAPAGIDALLRDLDAESVDNIRELVQLQIKFLGK